MKELVVISGKGGTGKTSITAAFAALAQNSILCDADVDAADLHLLMAPHILRKQDFSGGGIAVIDPEKCTQCGTCMDVCRFGAVNDDFVIDDIACEGCGVCVDFCPEGAIDFPARTCGQWFISDTRFGPMVHARLGIAEENSGKLVTLIRKEARRLAREAKSDWIITDGPPGIGCPVIASIGGADAVLVVAEPTVSGIHDMKRVAELAAHFKVPVMVCVNKYDLNPDQASVIEGVAKNGKTAFVGRIAFDPAFTDAMVQGKTVIEFNGASPAGEAVRRIWKEIQERMNN